jgi:hypothetical protein
MTYDDDYPTCANTDALLRIFSNENTPEEIPGILGISPTRTRIKGELRNPNDPRSINKVHCWYLGSKDAVNSKDCRRHLDWIVNKVYSSKEGFRKLKGLGAEFNICCIWESSENQGGPIMEPKQMGLLADLEIPVWWEFWYNYEDKKAHKK